MNKTETVTAAQAVAETIAEKSAPKEEVEVKAETLVPVDKDDDGA